MLGDDRYLEQVWEQADRPAFSGLISLDELAAVVCEAHGIVEAELMGKTQSRRYAKIRAEIAKKAVEAVVATLSQAARRFGRSDAVLCRSVKRYFRPGQTVR